MPFQVNRRKIVN